MKNIVVYLDVWDVHVAVYVGKFEDAKVWAKSMMKQPQLKELLDEMALEDEEKLKTQGITYYLQGGGSFIWLPKFDKGTLVHEMSHSVFHCLDNKGIELNEETDEVWGYTMECLYRKLL